MPWGDAESCAFDTWPCEKKMTSVRAIKIKAPDTGLEARTASFMNDNHCFDQDSTQSPQKKVN